MKISARAADLFAQAQSLPPETRAEFVTDACGPDKTLLEELTSLLAAADQSEEFFGQLSEKIGLPALANDEPALPENKQIGQWRLRRLIGRGGMGSVYLAERADQQFEQQAALKILPFGLDTEAARSRFLKERQILARLVHDNIARLLDGGVTEEGTPYFVMDYVDGVPIDQYCKQHQLSIEQRLHLFMFVAIAVQHAHRNLIVHRDLKPANVLVKESGEVILVDFGIAKTLYPDEGTALTKTGSMPMTSLYASPEMFKGDPITTQSDVYALGVLLYELLTDRHPYGLSRDTSEPEIWRAVSELDAIPPSKAVLEPPDPDQVLEVAAPRSVRDLSPRRLHQRLRGDIDTIVLKALRKNPEDRYGSAEELLADIRRHLAGQPVLAQRPTLGYRVKKFATRHKGLVGAGIASILFVLSVIYQSTKTAEEAERANREAQIAEQVSSFLVSIFQVSDPQRAKGNEVTAREILDKGAQEISADVIDDPEVHARLLSTIGEVYEQLALYPEAQQSYEKALALQRAEFGDNHQQTLHSMRLIGSVHMRQGRFADAQAILSKTLEGQRELLGNHDDETMATITNLAIAHSQQGDAVTATELIAESAALRREVFGLEHEQTINTIHNLAIFYQLQGKVDQAEARFLEILEPQRKVIGADHPNTMGLYHNLANLYSEQSRFDDAEPLYLEAVALAEKLLGAEHPSTAQATRNFANMYQKMGVLDKAEPLYVKAVAAQRNTLGDDHNETLRSILNLGALHAKQARYESAEKLITEAIDNSRRVLGDSHVVTLRGIEELSSVYNRLGRFDESRALTIELLAQRRSVAEQDTASADNKNTIAWALLTCEIEDLRDPATALEFATAANDETERNNPHFLRTLALAYQRNGNQQLAIQTQREAIGKLPAGALGLRDEFDRALADFQAGTD